MLRVYSQRVLNLKASERAIVANGRVLGPLESEEKFTLEDFALLERFITATYLEKINQALSKASDEDDGILIFYHTLSFFLYFLIFILELRSNAFLKVISLLVSRPQTRNRFEITASGDEYSVLKISATNPNQVAFDLVAVVDPVSRGAQKIGAILQVLQEVLNVNIKVFLNSVEKNSDMPVKRYLLSYR